MSTSKIPDWMQREVAEYDLDLNPPPALILDIGANIGAFSLHYSRKWPQAKIRAYEPVTENIAGLMANVEGQSNIEVYTRAVRSFDGEADIFLGDQGVTCGFFQRGRQTQNTQRVACVAAADLDPADLVKIDTEGCEVEIIAGYDFSQTRAVIVEYHSPEDLATITVVLYKNYGFKLLEHIPHDPGFGVLKFARPDAGVTLPEPAPARIPDANGNAAAEVTFTRPRKVYLAIASHYASNDLLFVQSLLSLSLHTSK